MCRARNIISHPEVCLLFHNIQMEGKPRDSPMNLILHLTSKKTSKAWGVGSTHMLVLEA